MKPPVVDGGDDFLTEEQLDDLTEEQRERIRLEMERDDNAVRESLANLEIEEEELETPKLSKKAKKRLKQRQKESSIAAPSETPIVAGNSTDVIEGMDDDHVTLTEATTPTATPEKKLSAKEKRRIRERQRQEEASRRKEELKKTELDCKVCSEEFDTRNQLFKHIKQVHSTNATRMNTDIYHVIVLVTLFCRDSTK